MWTNVAEKLKEKYPALIPAQKEFYEKLDEVLTMNEAVSKITVIPGRAGIGKSRYINELIQAVITEDNNEGLVIITDSVKRLRAYIDDGMTELIKKYGKKITVMEAENALVTKNQQKTRPILLLTTQRFFQMTFEERKELLTFNDGKGRRTKIICDEELYLMKQTNISLDTLNRLDTALNDGIDNLANQTEKEWCIRQFEALRAHLQEQMKQYETVSEKKQFYLWHNDPWDTLTEDDERFWRFITSSHIKGSINGSFPDGYNILLAIKQLLTEGGVFQCQKRGSGKNLEYSKMFSIITDNRKALLDLGVKIYVLDATADISPAYDHDCIQIIDTDKYNIPLENLTIEIVNVNTSKNAICGRTIGAKSKLNSVIEYLKSEKQVAVFSYKELEKRLSEHFQKCGYFGNLKGFNDYRTFNCVAQVGLNRFPPLTYFLLHSANDSTELEMIKSLPIEKQIDAFEKCISQNALTDNDMNYYILADLEQNIFRSAIRNMEEKADVKAIIFYNHREFAELTELIKWRYGKLGAKIKLVDAPQELKIEKIKNRNSQEMTNSQKILDWLDSLDSNVEFKIKDILESLSLTDKQFQKVKENNDVIKELFDGMKTKRKGYYYKK